MCVKYIIAFVNSSFHWWLGNPKWCALRAVFLDPPYLLEPHEEIGWGTRFLRPCKAGVPGYVFAKFLRERVLGGLIAQT